MRLFTVAIGVGLVLWTAGAMSVERSKPRTHTITIEHMEFRPAALTLAVGDTVVWVNKDLVPHTASSSRGGFDSRDIAAGGSWEYTVEKAGDIPYICTIHPAMKATLRVK